MARAAPPEKNDGETPRLRETGTSGGKNREEWRGMERKDERERKEREKRSMKYTREEMRGER